jgi:hypothetical protein
MAHIPLASPFADLKRPTSITAKLVGAVLALTTSDVLVGIPASKGIRKPGAGEKGKLPNNAELAYWHEFGVPSRNIPARPFVYPGMRKIRPLAVQLLAAAARRAMVSGEGPLPVLNHVGTLARDSLKQAITSPQPPFAPLKPSTIRARLRKTQAGKRQLRRLQLNAKTAGMTTAQLLVDWQTSPKDAGGLMMQPLIDTGQLRAAINYVIVPGIGVHMKTPQPRGISVASKYAQMYATSHNP